MPQSDNPYIVFPDNLLALNGKQNARGDNKDGGTIGYPQIEFTVQEDAKGGGSFKSIYLPMPGSIQFSDGGEYGSIDLGPIAGGGGIDVLADVMAGDISGAKGAAAGLINQQVNSVKTRLKATLASQLPGVDEETAMFALKKIKPPNQNTTFKGNTMREFTFTFKLIAGTQKDTDSIAAIHSTFRRYTYAGSSDDAPNVVLDYPPIWKIRFLIGTIENQYMPKIFACYLSSFGCTFNAETNMFRYDGSPFDVGFSLTFKETRVLTRRDIDNLEGLIGGAGGDTYRGINSKTGLATMSASAGTSIPVSSPSRSVAPTQSPNVNLPNNGSSGFPYSN